MSSNKIRNSIVKHLKQKGNYEEVDNFVIDTFRNSIVKHLKQKGNYEEVDNFVIDTLLENIEFANTLKEDIKANGLIIEIPNGNGFITRKENPAYGTFCKCQGIINECAKKLGISRADRLKLKIIEQKKLDELDDLING